MKYQADICGFPGNYKKFLCNKHLYLFHELVFIKMENSSTSINYSDGLWPQQLFPAKDENKLSRRHLNQ